MRNGSGWVFSKESTEGFGGGGCNHLTMPGGQKAQGAISVNLVEKFSPIEPSVRGTGEGAWSDGSMCLRERSSSLKPMALGARALRSTAMAMLLALLLVGGISLSAISCAQPNGNPGTEKEDNRPELKGTVTIDGTLKVGEELTANISTLTNRNGSASYEWKRGETTVVGTNSTYTLAITDLDGTITVTVTFSGSKGSISSQPTAEIGPSAEMEAESEYNNKTEFGSGNLSIVNGDAASVPNWTYKDWITKTISAYDLINLSTASKQDKHFALKISGQQLQLELKTLGGTATAVVSGGKIQLNAGTLQSADVAALQQALRLGIIELNPGWNAYANLGNADFRIEDHTQNPEVATTAATTTLAERIVTEHNGIKTATTGLEGWYKTILEGLPALNVRLENNAVQIPAWNEGDKVIFNGNASTADVKSGLMEVIHQRGAYQNISELADLPKFRPNVQVATKIVVDLYAYLSANGKFRGGTSGSAKGQNVGTVEDTMSNLSFDMDWEKRFWFLIPKYINGTEANGKKPMTDDEIGILFWAMREYSNFNFSNDAPLYMQDLLRTNSLRHVDNAKTAEFDVKNAQWDAAPISLLNGAELQKHNAIFKKLLMARGAFDNSRALTMTRRRGIYTATNSRMA